MHLPQGQEIQTIHFLPSQIKISHILANLMTSQEKMKAKLKSNINNINNLYKKKNHKRKKKELNILTSQTITE
jgi:hypothetical protein